MEADTEVSGGQHLGVATILQPRGHDTDMPQLEPQAEGERGARLGQEDDSCLSDLSPEAASLCRQLEEMGFPLSRLATGCRAVGQDSQKLINFCLVVDR